jgi:dihydroxyacetone kinase DhaKLM complex PTS-EIIA-like component DhaM
MANVGIVVVSHSPKVAEGAAEMVRQMDAIERAWSDAGVAILVDLGGAETNSEMAIELLDPERQQKVVVCNAPIVEGAVIAAAEASGGSSLEAVRRTAEELSPQ